MLRYKKNIRFHDLVAYNVETESRSLFSISIYLSENIIFLRLNTYTSFYQGCGVGVGVVESAGILGGAGVGKNVPTPTSV
jgi:hypothetical protein